jgi:hypothetical protein
VPADRHVRVEIAPELGDRAGRDLLGRHATLAEAGHQLHPAGSLDLEQERVTRSASVDRLDPALGFTPRELAPDHVELSLVDPARQLGDDGDGLPLPPPAGLILAVPVGATDVLHELDPSSIT